MYHKGIVGAMMGFMYRLLPFYNPHKGKGYIWSMSNPRGAYYQFEPTRSGKVANEMLRGYVQGNVVTDGFSDMTFWTKERKSGTAFAGHMQGTSSLKQ